MSSSGNGNSGNNNHNSSNRLHRVQKLAEPNSWRNSCNKRKRQIEGATSSPATSNTPFHLDQLPFNTLLVVASELPLDDLKNIGFISKKFNEAQRVTRYSRKKISVDLLRKLFPDEPLPGRNNNNTPIDHKCAGMMQVMRPLRRTLRSSPPRNINEMDLSELSAFRECHFVELLNFVSNGRELFSEVRRLNVQGCVLEIKDFTFLAKLMPKIWFIRCSAHTLVLPESTEQRTLSKEQLQTLRARVENFGQVVSQQFTRKQLWFLAQLTELFPCLEMVQLDN